MAKRKEVGLGEVSKVVDVDIAKDVDKIRRHELMKYAKEVLKVEARRVGPDGKNRVRDVADVRRDCKAVQSAWHDVGIGASRLQGRQRALE